MAEVIKAVCSRLGVEPDATLVRNVSQYMKSLRASVLVKARPDDIADGYVQSIKPVAALGGFDYDTYLQGAAYQEMEADADSPKKLCAIKAVTVFIDSSQRSGESSSPNVFDFALVPRHIRPASGGSGNIQVGAIPTHVTYFKIERIMLPYSEAMRTRNYSRELTLTFTALRNNGMISQNDTYHFMFTYEEVANNSNIVELKPTNKYCQFSPPLNVVDDLSLRFNDPIVPVSFPPDRLSTQSVNYQSSDGRVTFADPHMLTSGDVVIVDRLSTHDDNANRDALGRINDPRGVVINVIDAHTIALGVDFTALTSHDLDCKPSVLVQSRTFRFPLEIGFQG